MLWSPRVSRTVIRHGKFYRDEIRTCPRARRASGSSQNAAQLSLGQRISDQKGRGPSGRHKRNPPPNPDYLGTAGQARAAGSRPHLEAKLPQSRTILFNECGHLPQLEQPGQFNLAVLDFLSGEAPHP